ncbi:MAG: glycosyltransferase family 4 protein [Candidatus Bathyarchaeota archaeon]|nr:glycosyltransferase family 4 protein [Candidatus Bathyarchaeota archaeon]
MMKKVYFKTLGLMHSSFLDLINYPPEGYQFIMDENLKNDALARKSELSRYRWSLERLLPANLTKAWLESNLRRFPKDANLIYSYNHVIFRRKPWIVQAEFAHPLIGRGLRHFERFKKLVERNLASKYCKRILLLSEFAKKSFALNFNLDDFKNKMEIVLPSVHKKNFIKTYDKDDINLLFLGSINIPHTFEHKGGKEVLEAFFRLSKEYDNLKLTIRAKIPEYIKTKYKVAKNPRIRLIEEMLPRKLLEQEFVNADIFLFPTHEAHNFVVLDAMSYGLPVITTEIGSTGRVDDGETGFAVSKIPPLSCAVELIQRGYEIYGCVPVKRILSTDTILNRSKCVRTIQVFEREITQELIEKARILIENPKLRKQMGEKAKWEIEHGKFSIKARNRKLKGIFDEATKD